MSSPHPPLADTSRHPRQPLAQLPLHIFVAQSLASPSRSLSKSPSRFSTSSSVPKSQANSRSVSPHKQAVLQSHQRAKDGSTSSSLSSSTSTLSRVTIHAESGLPCQKLFQDIQQTDPNLDDSLENSPALPVPRRHTASPTMTPKHLKFTASPHASLNADVITTPRDAKPTPANIRHHRPSPTTGPKYYPFIESSPSTERHTGTLLKSFKRNSMLQYDVNQQPTTPSTIHDSLVSRTSPSEKSRILDDQDNDESSSSDETDEETIPASPSKIPALQSLRKKRYRVSKTEVAMAHEIVGSGPIGSPSPRKVSNRVVRTAPDSPTRRATTRDLCAKESPDRFSDLEDLGDLTTQQPVSLLTESASGQLLGHPTILRRNSGLFANLLAKPVGEWTVFQDPVEDDSSTTATWPSQDPSTSPTSVAFQQIRCDNNVSPPNSNPSTPNKENRDPDSIKTRLQVSIQECDLTAAAKSDETKVKTSSSTPARKRGTGGRLSLVARANDSATEDEMSENQDEREASDVSSTESTSPPKKARSESFDESPSRAPTDSLLLPKQNTATIKKKASHRMLPKKASPVSSSPEGRRSRGLRTAFTVDHSVSKKMSTSSLKSFNPAGVASRTRSKTRS